MSEYLLGVDLEACGAAAGRKGGQAVGAALAPSAPSGRSVLITVRDVPALVQAQGGKSGALVDRFVPDTIENTVYQRMATEIAQGMKDKGVDADVRVVTTAGYKRAPTPDFTRGIWIGAGAAGVGWLAWTYGIKGLLR